MFTLNGTGYTKEATIVIAICLIIWAVASVSLLLHVDSSDKSLWRKSGLRVYTDHATGVQYVGAGWSGAITPRLSKTGNLYQDPKEKK